MTASDPTSAGFHEGELAVQDAAGVREQSARLESMLGPVDLTGGADHFLAGQRFAVLTARDDTGRRWVSALSGSPGFLEVVSPTTLVVRAWPVSDDALDRLPSAQEVGLVVLDLARRRRFRINGWLHLADAGSRTLMIDVEQAYGNCPQYIQQRALGPGQPAKQGDGIATVAGSTTELSSADEALIRRADTFFLGSAHPRRGADASHRGGSPGFVRVTDETHLWWPDYPGNNMFNSLGNLAVDPTAALLFVDFAAGQTLQLSGVGAVDQVEPGVHGDDGRTGRRVRFTVEQVRRTASPALHASAVSPYRLNPPVTV